MGLDIYYELSRRTININKNVETSILWHNSILTIRSDKGLHFYDFSYNLESLDKEIDCTETFIPSSKTSPATNIFKNKLLKSISNVELTEMVVDPALWPHNTYLTQEMSNISDFKWSPFGFIENKECALAVLNNIGNIDLFVVQQTVCSKILNVSLYVNEHNEECLKPPENFEKLKQAVYTVESCALCWAPKLNQNNSCYFVTAQKNSNILFWLLKSDQSHIDIKLKGCINLEIFEIVSIAWIPKTDVDFFLICSNSMGQIIALDCQIQKDEVKLLHSHILWTHKDRMIARYLHYTVIKDKVVLICNKHRHLVIILFDFSCHILSQYVNNVNDNRITSITDSSDGFYLATVNCQIYKINFRIIDNNLAVNLSLIEKKDSYSSHELYSLSFSSNNVICVLGLVDRKLFSRKEQMCIEIIFLSNETKLDSLVSLLLDNPTKKLTSFWDVIELLRYYTNKFKLMPPIDYVQLHTESSSDVYKLKLYCILATLFKNLIITFKLRTTELLPEISIETIKEKIFVAHAKTMLCNFYNIYQKNGDLNNFDKECFFGAKRYLEYFCNKYENDITQYVDSSVINIFKYNCEYICQCCENKIEGFSCKSGHINIFCSLTFTLIDSDDYLVCKCCRCTARVELYQQKPLCIFCDQYLFKINI